mgnify:CR=1 FL=1
MAFPTVIYGPEGEQFSTYTTRRWPLGTQLRLPDGRNYRFCKAGGSALVVGNVIQTPANISTHVDLTVVSGAAGATQIVATLGATNAATLDQYAEGYAVVSVTPGAGHIYKIKGHAAADAAANITLDLMPGKTVEVALTTTSRLDLIYNPYDLVIQAPATTLTGNPVGVAVTAVAASAYGWIQARWLAAVLTAGTVVIGQLAISPTGTAGACGPQSATYVATETILGQVRRVAATTAWSTISLLLPS